MRKTVLLIAACAVAAVLISAVYTMFWSQGLAVGPTKITAVFSGFTNAATGTRLARFRVSNQAGVTVYRWPTYSIEERGRVSPPYLASFRRGDLLVPAQSRIYVLPVPTNDAPWRVVFNFSRETWRRKLAGLSVFRRVVPSRALAFPVDEAISDWVGLEASSPPASGQRQRMATTIILPPHPLFQPQTNANPNAAPPKK